MSSLKQYNMGLLVTLHAWYVHTFSGSFDSEAPSSTSERASILFLRSMACRSRAAMWERRSEEYWCTFSDLVASAWKSRFWEGEGRGREGEGRGGEGRGGEGRGGEGRGGEGRGGEGRGGVRGKRGKGIFQ